MKRDEATPPIPISRRTAMADCLGREILLRTIPEKGAESFLQPRYPVARRGGLGVTAMDKAMRRRRNRRFVPGRTRMTRSMLATSKAIDSRSSRGSSFRSRSAVCVKSLRHLPRRRSFVSRCLDCRSGDETVRRDAASPPKCKTTFENLKAVPRMRALLYFQPSDIRRQ